MNPGDTVSKRELVEYAMRQMDIVESEAERIDTAFKNVQTSAQAAELYADTRENAGKQRVLRHMLETFGANTVIGSGKIVENGSDEMGFRR